MPRPGHPLHRRRGTQRVQGAFVGICRTQQASDVQQVPSSLRADDGGNVGTADARQDVPGDRSFDFSVKAVRRCMTFDTCNSSSWKSLKTYLQSESLGQVVAFQDFAFGDDHRE
eukprot:225334-Pyramimonas_sp.AAC.1